MTYIVDQRVIEGSEIADSTKGQLAMGKARDDEAKFFQLVGEDKNSLHIESDELENLLSDITKYLTIIALHLNHGSDLNIGIEDTEDI
jgi:hypothetical protein